MLPVDSLNEETYEDIRKNAIQSIARYQKEWTNYNASDAGITLLELLAWMQEMQVFYLNRYERENEPLYLELLGRKPYERQPSALLADVTVEQETGIYNNTRFVADSICFEPEAEGHLGCERLVSCYAQNGDGTLLWSCTGEELQYGRWMFGEQPKPGHCFYLCFDRPVSLSCRHALYLELELPEGMERNPVAREKGALFSSFQLDYWDGFYWQPCTVLEDETAGLIQSGCLHWRAEGEMGALEELYWLRIRLLDCDFDIPPRLLEVNTRKVRLVQKETLTTSLELRLPVSADGICWIELWNYMEELPETEAEAFIILGEIYQRVENCFREGKRLGFRYFRETEQLLKVLLVIKQGGGISTSWEATGFPGQVIRLEDCHIMGSRMQVLVEREDHPGEYRFWKPVMHFWKAASNEECYRFREETGELIFGDGIHGKIPEGRILLTECIRTLGPEGSVKERTCFQWRKGRAYCRKAALGGRNPEKASACMERFRQQTEKETRGVTGEDYEKLVKQTPGLIIQKVHAVSGMDNSLTLVVEGGGGRKGKGLSPIYRREIRSWLEEKRMLGTRLQLEAPEYIPIRVRAVILGCRRFHQAEDWIGKAIEEFFLENMKEFGAEFSYSRLYGILDGLSCVADIQTLTVTTAGKGIQYGRDGSFRLPDRGLAVLEEVQIQLIQENRG